MLELEKKRQGLRDTIAAERKKRQSAERDRQKLLDHIKAYGGLSSKARLIADGVWRMPDFYPSGEIKTVGDEEDYYRPIRFKLGDLSLEEVIANAINPFDPFFLKELIERFGIDSVLDVIK